jgi:hypothetical protein
MNVTRTILACFVLGIGGMERAWGADDSQSEARFQGATNIVFEYCSLGETNQPETKRFTVNDAKDLRGLIGCIHLVPFKHGAPWDFHVYSAIFQGPSGETTVSFCTTCFDIVVSPNPRYSVARYQMPKEFYAKFRKLARKHRWILEGP